jgi:hypothetical protein
MRKTLLFLLLVTPFIGCNKNEPGYLEYVEAIEGGCFLEKGSSLKNDPFTKPDTVTYSVASDSLNIFVGFNATCCSEYSASSTIDGDSILIKIQTTHIGLCNCICYYTYNFRFSGCGNSYKYCVDVDGNLNFNGVIKRL